LSVSEKVLDRVLNTLIAFSAGTILGAAVLDLLRRPWLATNSPREMGDFILVYAGVDAQRATIVSFGAAPSIVAGGHLVSLFIPGSWAHSGVSCFPRLQTWSQSSEAGALVEVDGAALVFLVEGGLFTPWASSSTTHKGIISGSLSLSP